MSEVTDDGRVLITRSVPSFVPAPIPPIPAFLIRHDRLTDEQLRQLTRSHENRTWIMPDMSKYAKTTIEETDMAKADFYIENRSAPVHVYAYPVEGDAKPFHIFPDAEAFETWYRPGKMRSCGQNAQTEFTDVLLDLPSGTPRPSDAAPVRRAGASTGVPSTRATAPLSRGVSPHTPSGSPPRAGEKVSVRAADAIDGDYVVEKVVGGGKSVSEGQRYIDSRHVALMEAAGLVNCGTWPMKFRYARQEGLANKTIEVDFEPPPPGRRWATTWSFPGAAGRGVSTLFAALGIKGDKK